MEVIKTHHTHKKMALSVYITWQDIDSSSEIWLFLYELKIINYTTQSLITFSNLLTRKAKYNKKLLWKYTLDYFPLTTLDYNFVNFLGNLENCVILKIFYYILFLY